MGHTDTDGGGTLDKAELAAAIQRGEERGFRKPVCRHGTYMGMERVCRHVCGHVYGLVHVRL